MVGFLCDSCQNQQKVGALKNDSKSNTRPRPDQSLTGRMPLLNSKEQGPSVHARWTDNGLLNLSEEMQRIASHWQQVQY